MVIDTSETHILVLSAVPEEAEGIKRELAPAAVTTVGGRVVFSGKIGAASVRLMVTGPGMVNTAQGLTAEIENRVPAAILMTGCAGGFARAGMQVGDIGIATEENDAHLGIEPDVDGQPLLSLPFGIAIFDGVVVKHRILADNRLSSMALNILENEFRGLPLNIVQGPFVTVATITATDHGADRLYARFRPCMENMEGVAAAHVAKHYDLPFLEIRCASNQVGKRDRASWNLPLACERSAAAAVAWLRRYKKIASDP